MSNVVQLHQKSRKSRVRDEDISPDVCKELLGCHVDSTAEWRERKAAEYPSDTRNEMSANALRQLSARLDEIPESDPIWLRLGRAYFSMSEWDQLEYTNGIEGQSLSRYGFGPDATEVTDADALEFVNGLIAECESHACEDGDE